MSKQIYIVWPDIEISISLFDNPAADYYYNCIKHLQHVDLEFDERTNGLLNIDFDLIADKLFRCANLIDLTVDKLMLRQQEYLNYLHDIYFNNVNKDVKQDYNTNWLNFHHYIHLLEEINGQRARLKIVWFDYLKKAGLLSHALDRSWVKKYAVQNVDAGTCFIKSHELGKAPLLYKQDNDTRNIMQLAVPWKIMRPIVDVPVEDIRTYDYFVKHEQEDFDRWFAPYREEWCKYHQLTDWTPAEMFAKIPIGQLDDVKIFRQRFEQGNYPKRIRR